MSLSWAVAERRQKGARRVHTIHEQRATFPSPGHEGLGSRRGCPAFPSPSSPTPQPPNSTSSRQGRPRRIVLPGQSCHYHLGGAFSVMTCQHGRPRTLEPPLAPTATAVRVLRPPPAGRGAGAVALLAWAVAAPAFTPAGALAAEPAPALAASPRPVSRAPPRGAPAPWPGSGDRGGGRGRTRPGGGPAGGRRDRRHRHPAAWGPGRRRRRHPRPHPARLPRGRGLGGRVRPGLPALLDGPGRHRPHRVQPRPVRGPGDQVQRRPGR